jgi:hypothetical protein
MINRERMTYIYITFLLIWYAGTLIAIKYLGLSAIEGVGLGTAGGVFLGGFQNMWQFLWRKPSGKEKK